MAVNSQFVKELVELADGDSWRMADRILEEFPVESFGLPERGKNTGLFAELEPYEDALRREHGIELSAAHMARMRTTAIRYPNRVRAQSTSFSVHVKLSGKDGPLEMAKRLRQAAREGSALTVKMLGRFRTDEKAKKPPLPLDEQIRRRVESVLKTLILGARVIKRPDWWTHGGINQETRDIAVRVLRQLASEIASHEDA